MTTGLTGGYARDMTTIERQPQGADPTGTVHLLSEVAATINRGDTDRLRQTATRDHLIRRLRAETGWSLRRIAEIAEVSHETVRDAIRRG